MRVWQAAWFIGFSVLGGAISSSAVSFQIGINYLPGELILH